MIGLKGIYNFSNFATWLANPSNPIQLAFSAGIEITENEIDGAYILVPLNPSFENPTFQINGFSYIEFKLFDKTFSRLSSFIVLELSPHYFLFIPGKEFNNLSSGLGQKVIDTLCYFLHSEFEVVKVLLIADIKDICLSPNVLELDLTSGTTDFDFQLSKLLPHALEIFPSSSSHIPEEILTAGPSISSLEQSYVANAVAHGWNSNHSDYLNTFQNEFATLVGTKFALATSSCTGALHLALLALGIGPGDEVIVPDITWVATASAVMYVGAKPIFVDVDSNYWTLDISKAREAITPRTKAIIPVHLYGFGAPMPDLMQLANEFDLAVIEDAAPAIGTQIDSRFAGSFGQFGCYSFQGAKLLVTGEGGMLVTNSPELFEKARKLQDHGRTPGTFWIEEVGYKYKMNNITAALGLAQIQRSKNQIEKKRQINMWYRENLSDLSCIRFQEESLGTKSICWLTSFSLLSESRVSRNQLIEILKVNKIDSRPTFPAISQYPIWGYDPQVQSVAKVIGESGINLPSGVLISKAAVDKVCEVILQTLSK